MISENLKQLLLHRDEASELDFKSLVHFLEESKYEFIGGRLRGVLGLATVNKAFFDIGWLSQEDNQLIFFVVLHEYAHVLKIEKMGKEKLISLFSLEELQDFADHVIGEEIMADRFGRLFFYQFNKQLYPKYRTQQLEKPHNQSLYKHQIAELHGVVNDEKSYDEMIEFIVMDWTSINNDTPEWYKEVELLVNGKLRKNFHRLQGDDNIYYGTLESDEIIFEDEVTHWRELEDNEEN